MSKAITATKTVIWKRKLINTATAAYRENALMAGMVARAPEIKNCFFTISDKLFSGHFDDP